MKKKKNRGWFPRTRAKQKTMFTNMKAKVENYKDILPLSTAKIDRIILICDIFLTVLDYVEQTRATVGGLSDWQDLIFTAEGGTQGEPAPAAPAFQTLTLPAGSFVGIFAEFQEIVAQIKESDGYTTAIGDDLMIRGEESEERDPSEMSPDLKISTTTGSYKVKIGGSLDGMKAIKVEYYKKGANIPQSFFLNKLPGEITVIPTQAGETESGQIRAVFFEDNEEVGEWSPNYSLTVG